MKNDKLLLTRRQLLTSGSAALTTLIFPKLSFATATSKFERKLILYNTHTSEWFKDIFWEDGHYIPEQLEALNYFLRDPSNGKTTIIEPRLLDLMNSIQMTISEKKPFEIISGYRSKEFNDQLRKKGKGVAQNSKHIEGKAVDIRMSGVQLVKLRDAAKAERVGGVGFYPKSNFVHIDIRKECVYW
ncbi:MAG: hypothetical protein BGO76_07925 [Caedibacter sp. 38-128]|nr:DUF882 domain-containing protein [Holosporales bacterium]OJX03238.1 MAG: hypothetical protein BGO76_07925 [Caedibacter sp. 38-128]